MKRNILIITIFIIILLTVSACATQSSGDNAAQAVDAYLNALVNKDADRLSTLSCAAWEPSAQLELESFQGVTTSLEGLSCQASGTDGDQTLVKCEGKIIAGYQGENQEFNLSDWTYQVVQQNGEWLVCGYQ